MPYKHYMSLVAHNHDEHYSKKRPKPNKLPAIQPCTKLTILIKGPIGCLTQPKKIEVNLMY